MRRKLTSLSLIEDICKLMIIQRHSRYVQTFGRELSGMEIYSRQMKINAELGWVDPSSLQALQKATALISNILGTRLSADGSGKFGG
jgi:hypothetical protein